MNIVINTLQQVYEYLCLTNSLKKQQFFFIAHIQKLCEHIYENLEHNILFIILSYYIILYVFIHYKYTI